MKSNRILAVCLCAAIAAGSAGLLLARQSQPELPYRADELELRQGQYEYDLLQGIEYDANPYQLAVAETGAFVITVPGA